MERQLPKDRLAEALRRLYAIGELETLSHFWQGEPKILYHLYFRQNQEVNPSELSEALGVTRAHHLNPFQLARQRNDCLLYTS